MLFLRNPMMDLLSKIHLGVDTKDDLKKANEIAKDDSYK